MPASKKLDSRLANIYSQQGDKQTHYDDWAESYESDLVGDLGYVAHLRCAEIFHKVVPELNAATLDLGCGTGLAGEALKKLGYANLDGADFSERMLEVAARRGVYCNLRRHDITQALQLTTLYDALISVGLFSYGIPNICDLHNAVNCVRPGRLCVVSVNGAAWVEHNLERAVRDEAKAHDFFIEDIIETDYIVKENIKAQTLVLRRAAE